MKNKDIDEHNESRVMDMLRANTREIELLGKTEQLQDLRIEALRLMVSDLIGIVDGLLDEGENA